MAKTKLTKNLGGTTGGAYGYVKETRVVKFKAVRCRWGKRYSGELSGECDQKIAKKAIPMWNRLNGATFELVHFDGSVVSTDIGTISALYGVTILYVKHPVKLPSKAPPTKAATASAAPASVSTSKPAKHALRPARAAATPTTAVASDCPRLVGMVTPTMGVIVRAQKVATGVRRFATDQGREGVMLDQFRNQKVPEGVRHPKGWYPGEFEWSKYLAA